MEAVLARGAQLLLALASAYAIALWWASIVWTFRDIESRSRSVVTQVVSTLMAVIFPFVGLPLYLILRPKETLDAAFQRSLEEEYLLQDLEELPLCPQCQHFVQDDFVLCPHCHARLRDACGGCSRLVDLRWALCPYCGVVQDGKEVAAQRVEEPASRWIAPNLRRRRSLPASASTEPAASRAAALSDSVDRDGSGSGAAADGLIASSSRPEGEPAPFTVVVGSKTLGERLDRLRGYTAGRRPGSVEHRGDRSDAGTPQGLAAADDLALPSSVGDGREAREERKTPRFARLAPNLSDGRSAAPREAPVAPGADGVGAGSIPGNGHESTEERQTVTAGHRAQGD